MTERWFEMLPIRQLECWTGGARSVEPLVEVQAEQVIPAFGSRPWPAQYLARDPAMAFCDMRHVAKQVGLSLWIRYGWRSHALQQRFWSEWEDGLRKLRPARPGYSRHEGGRAIDVLRSHDDPDGGGPQLGPTDIWLAENSRFWGWRRTVPAELWHWEQSDDWKELT